MNKNIRIMLAILLLAISILACASPLQGGGNEPSATNEPSSSDQVATVVASTLQALTPNSPNPPVANTPQSPSSLLSHRLYFLNNDSAGIAQVFRLETDGKNRKTDHFRAYSRRLV